MKVYLSQLHNLNHPVLGTISKSSVQCRQSKQTK